MMLYNSPHELNISGSMELIPRTDNAAPDEAEKGLLRTWRVETGLIREGALGCSRAPEW
jgi:hypothetical protein